MAGKLGGAGWVQVDADPNLWLMKNSAGDVVAALLFYVDGMQIATKD